MENRNYKDLYTEEDISTLKIAEDSLDPKVDRVDEIIEYCKEADIKKIGIAHCVSFNKQVDKLKNKLSSEGFTVENVHCKLGKMRFDELVPGYKGVTCNPAGQAAYLAEKGTELNIMIGLCLGHDIIFNSKSKAPVTPLVVKDRKHKHYPFAALKNAE